MATKCPQSSGPPPPDPAFLRHPLALSCRKAFTAVLRLAGNPPCGSLAVAGRTIPPGPMVAWTTPGSAPASACALTTTLGTTSSRTTLNGASTQLSVTTLVATAPGEDQAQAHDDGSWRRAEFRMGSPHLLDGSPLCGQSGGACAPMLPFCRGLV